MPSPPPGPEHDRVAGEDGWARDLRERPEPSPSELLEEPLWTTIRKVVASPRVAMVDLGRDVDALGKGVLVALAYAIVAALPVAARYALDYPAGVDYPFGPLWVLLVVPLSLLSVLISTFVVRLTIPVGLDRSVGTVFARMALATVPAFGYLFVELVELTFVALGLLQPDEAHGLFQEGPVLWLVLLLLTLWSLVVTGIAIRVATERHVLTVILILLAAGIAGSVPALVPYLLV